MSGVTPTTAKRRVMGRIELSDRSVGHGGSPGGESPHAGPSTPRIVASSNGSSALTRSGSVRAKVDLSSALTSPPIADSPGLGSSRSAVGTNLRGAGGRTTPGPSSSASSHVINPAAGSSPFSPARGSPRAGALSPTNSTRSESAFQSSPLHRGGEPPPLVTVRGTRPKIRALGSSASAVTSPNGIPTGSSPLAMLSQAGSVLGSNQNTPLSRAPASTITPTTSVSTRPHSLVSPPTAADARRSDMTPTPLARAGVHASASVSGRATPSSLGRPPAKVKVKHMDDRKASSRSPSPSERAMSPRFKASDNVKNGHARPPPAPLANASLRGNHASNGPQSPPLSPKATTTPLSFLAGSSSAFGSPQVSAGNSPNVNTPSSFVGAAHATGYFTSTNRRRQSSSFSVSSDSASASGSTLSTRPSAVVGLPSASGTTARLSGGNLSYQGLSPSHTPRSSVRGSISYTGHPPFFTEITAHASPTVPSTPHSGGIPLLSPALSEHSVHAASSPALTPAEAARAAEAKKARKILDLEITNKSLLAINAALEVTKVQQAKEIRELKRRLREGGGALLMGDAGRADSDVGTTTSWGDGASSGSDESGETDEDGEDGEGSKRQKPVLLRGNPELEAAHVRCRSLIDKMLADARAGLLYEYQPVKEGAKVLHVSEVRRALVDATIGPTVGGLESADVTADTTSETQDISNVSNSYGDVSDLTDGVETDANNSTIDISSIDVSIDPSGVASEALSEKLLGSSVTTLSSRSRTSTHTDRTVSGRQADEGEGSISISGADTTADTSASDTSGLLTDSSFADSEVASEEDEDGERRPKQIPAVVTRIGDPDISVD